MRAEDIDQRAGLRLAGLVDGEGCFYIKPRACSFIIKLRADDLPMLERYRDACGGIGRIRRQERTNGWAPTVAWVVDKKHDVGVIRDLFVIFPLWSKKRRDFEVWARAVDFWIHCTGYGTDWTPVEEARAELREVRKYVEAAA